MLGTFGDPNWATLIDRIKRGECTPFLGAGIAAEHLPTGSEVATCWARQYSYPMPDITNLIKVSQFVGLKERDLRRPKEMIIEIINEAQYPDFTDTHEPHAVLAKLPLPLYMTTNYDDFMYAALESQGKQPQLFINQWNDDPEASASPVDINPTDRSPAVYHFHGHKDYPDTLVLTEDDYLDFLVRISKDQGLIPSRIQQALAGTQLLFIGYSLGDMNFRVIFRGLVEAVKKNKRRVSIAVQIRPSDATIMEYLTQYFDEARILVYWGTAREFVTELDRRWR